MRQIWARALVLVVLFACASGAGCASEDPPTKSSASTRVETAALPGEGGVLVQLLERGADASFHATYEVQRDATVESTLEIWQSGTQSRADSSPTGGGTVSVFTRPKSTIVCTHEAAWSCRRDATARNTLDEFVAQAVNDLTGLEIVASDATIAGQKVRCFDVTAAGGLQICATSTGVPARMASAGSKMELTHFDQKVSTADFRLPATVAD